MATPGTGNIQLSQSLPGDVALHEGESVVAVIYPWWPVVLGFYIVTLGLYEFWRRRHYIALTNQRLIAAHGIVIYKSNRSIPLPRVQDATYGRSTWAGVVEISSAGGVLGALRESLYRPREARAFVNLVNDAARQHRSSGLGDSTPAATTENVPDALRQLAMLHEEGLIDAAEYEAKRQELLKRLQRLGEVLAVQPRIGGDVFRYRLHSSDGDDLGEATYVQMIHLGDEIHLGAGQRFRVLDVVPFEEEDESPFVGLLRVEAA